MKHLLFLVLLAQTIFHSHAADGGEQHKTGIQGLIKAAKSEEHGTNARFALDYLLRAGKDRTLKPGRDAKQALKEFGVDKNHVGGTLQKLWTKTGNIYRFTPFKRSTTKVKEIKRPTIRGGGKTMTQTQATKPVRAAKKDLKEMLQDVHDTKESLLGKCVRHNKTGNIYTVFGITIGVATQAPMVHYKDNNAEWTRTLDDFLSIDTINGEKIQKFELVKE